MKSTQKSVSKGQWKWLWASLLCYGNKHFVQYFPFQRPMYFQQSVSCFLGAACLLNVAVVLPINSAPFDCSILPALLSLCNSVLQLLGSIGGAETQPLCTITSLHCCFPLRSSECCRFLSKIRSFCYPVIEEQVFIQISINTTMW